jgi:tRNA G10  N-methylase Trm11
MKTLHRQTPRETEFAAICARSQHNALVAEECASLTSGTPDADGVALCESVAHVPRAAYVREGVRFLARGTTLKELVTAVAAADIPAEEFRIDVHSSVDSLGRTHREATVALADALPFRPDLEDPRHRFLVVETDDDLRFGEVVTESTRSYRRHDGKPRRTSSSLSSRLSRALVNLVTPAQTLLDPCCGTGSILLEARSLGVDAFGADWNETMVEMARENLTHFDYDAAVERADARSYTRTADAIVTDLPYGRSLRADDSVIREILRQGATLAPLAVYVAGERITEWLVDAGYRDVSVHPVFKQAGSARYVHVARSERSTEER